MTARGAAAGAVATALAILLAASAAAQTVTGTASDAELGRPLAGAALLLVDSDGAAVDSARADARGAFRLRAPAAGNYIIHVRLDGWAGVPSEEFTVSPGEDGQVDVRIPLIGMAALRQMSSMLEDEELQRPLEETCGEALRPWEAGLLLGVVRDRRSRAPVAGARVWAASPDGELIRSTVSNDRGKYVLCNLAAGADLRVSAETPDGRAGAVRPEIRAGVAAWFDVMVSAGGSAPR